MCPLVTRCCDDPVARLPGTLLTTSPGRGGGALQIGPDLSPILWSGWSGVLGLVGEEAAKLVVVVGLVVVTSNMLLLQGWRMVYMMVPGYDDGPCR